MDNSVRPGDDFYMHRIGSWWANTPLIDFRILPKILGYTTDAEEWVDKIKPASPSAKKLEAHLDNLDAQSQQAASFLESTWTACGFAEARDEAEAKGSTEPLWKCFGMSNSKSALEDAYLLRKAAFNYSKSLVGKPLKDASFHLIISPDSDAPLSEFNAFYVTNLNSINIYPWWLMKPIYDPAYNQAFNYAVMTVVGHEITHGFDSDGYKFNKDGDPISIFTNPADEAKFVELGKKLAASYNELEVLPTEMPGEMSRGDFCLAENIADLGGFEIGFEAYTRYLQEQGFTGDELYLAPANRVHIW